MAEGKILPYIDVPFQHASPRILKAMKRPASSSNTMAQINRWREICPDIAIRSTFIVGFPGETDDDFQQLLDFLREAQLERVGCFQYSPVQGATANAIENQVPDEVKEERWHRFMQTQAEISEDKLEQKVGRSLDVLIDTIDEEVATARSYADAPEIDGVVRVYGGEDLAVGDIIKVNIEEATEYDLIASVAD